MESEEHSESHKRLYFDTLDISAAEIIVRQLSAIPNSIQWHSYIDVHQMLKLYSMDGILSTASRNMFNGIYARREEHKDLNEKGIRSISYDSNRFNEKTLDKLSQAAGTSFKRLMLVSESSESEVRQNGQRLCARFENVTELCVSQNIVADMIRYMGDRLRHLSIYGACRTQIGLSPCVNLRELSLDSVTLSWLQRTRVWELVGGHLEKLKFCVLFSDRADKLREEVRKIPQHCRHLRDASIRLTPSTFLRDEVAQCYATYGAQLLHAHAFGMTPAQCNVIRNACPNAVLSIQLSNRDSHLALSLRAAAPFAQRVTIDCHYRAVPLHAPLDVSDWPLLRYLSLHGVTRHATEFARAIFAAPMPMLTELDIGVQGNQESLFLEIAGATSALKRFSVEGLDRVPVAMRALVDANRELIFARIGLMPEFGDFGNRNAPQEAQLDSIRDVVNIFVHAPKLRELVISPKGLTLHKQHMTWIRNLYIRFRLRQVHMEIVARSTGF